MLSAVLPNMLDTSQIVHPLSSSKSHVRQHIRLSIHLSVHMPKAHLNAPSITVLHVVQLFVQSLQDLVVCHLNSLISHTSVLNPSLDPFAHRLDQKALRFGCHSDDGEGTC
jgi:hypothetical protein